MVVVCVMAAGGDDANGDCGAGGNEFGGAGVEGGGGASDTSLLYTSPRVDRDVQQGMSNRENIGFTSLGTTSFTTTPDPLVQL